MQDSSSINAFSWFSMFYIPGGGICKLRTKTRTKSKRENERGQKIYQTKDPIPIFFPRFMSHLFLCSALLFTLDLQIPPLSAKEHLEKYKIQDRDDAELAIDNDGLYESKLYGN